MLGTGEVSSIVKATPFNVPVVALVQIAPVKAEDADEFNNAF